MSQPSNTSSANPEKIRLAQDSRREKNWKRWGPYLSERQWGTVREDYSSNGDSWTHLSHEKSRSQSYRWGEDGLLGITVANVESVLRWRCGMVRMTFSKNVCSV